MSIFFKTATEKLKISFDKLQADIVGIQSDIKTLEARPMDADAAEKSFRSYVDMVKMDESRLAKFASGIAHGNVINEWSNPFVSECFDQLEGLDPVSSQYIRADLAPVILALFPDVVTKRMVPLIRAYCDDNDGITTQEKEKQLKALTTRLTKLEGEEEDCVAEAEESEFWGLVRRQDIDPAIVLNYQG
ncbi:MAG: hypothetical protein JKY88_06665 [Pseudomonadales bacterium]|nr:hypothetical protein [Pseudomonadales bacterium]